MTLHRIRHAVALVMLALAAACSEDVPVDPGATPAGPAAPTWTGILPAAIANDNEPTLQGKADARVTVHVYGDACDGALLGTTVADATGAFVLRVKVADDTITTFHALASDADGKSSPCSEKLTYTEDSTAPLAPVWPADPLPAANENAPTLQGSSEAGATVRLYTNSSCSGAAVAEAVAGGDGAFSAQASVADDSRTEFFASATDAAGNSSGCSAARAYVEDSKPPEIPALTGVLPGPVSSENRPTLEGTGEPGATIRIFGKAACADAAMATVVADEAGKFSATVDVPDNSVTTFTASALDAAGNASGCSAELTYTELSQTPATPTWSAQLPAANENEPTVEGQADAGLEVEIFGVAGCAGAALTTVQADAQGRFSAKLLVQDDTTTRFTAQAINAAGLRSACSAELVYVEDSTPPAKPVLTGTNPASPSQSSAPTISGTADPASAVRVFSGGTCTGTSIDTVADASGAFSVQLTVSPNATVTVRANAVDAVGNVSDCSTPLVYVSDSTAPAAPQLTGFSPGSPGTDPTPEVLVVTDALATIEVFAGPGCSGAAIATGTASSLGGVRVEVQAALNGSATFSVKATDRAGNVSPCSASIDYVHDDQPPPAPVLGTIQPGAIGNSNSPSISGTAGANLRIELFLTACTGAPRATGNANGSGDFTVAVPVGSDATHLIHARAVDAAGNASSCVGPLQYVEDSTAPSIAGATVLDGPGVDLAFQRSGSDLDASWSGFTDANGITGYERNVSRTTGCLGEVVPLLDVGLLTEHRWSGALTEGLHYTCIRARDEAGNRSAWKASNGITVDFTPPALLSIAPADAAIDVELRTPVVLTFSEPIGDTAAASLGLIIGGQPHPVTVSWNGPSNVATLSPQVPYPHLAQVTARVGAGLTDRAGNATTQNIDRGFRARDWRWEAPAKLQAQSWYGGYTTIATDHAGRAVAIWGEGNNPWRLWTKTYVPGQGWGAASRLAPAAVGLTVDPAIAIGRNGAGMAAWVQEDGPRRNVYAATWSASAGWGTPALVETHAADGSRPRVFVDGAGNATVGWSAHDGTNWSVWVNRYTPGAGWGTAQMLETLSYGNSVDAIFGNDTGDVMALWVNSGDVTLSRFAQSTGWSTPAVINPGDTSFVDDAWGAMSADGSALVVYSRRNNLAHDLYARRYVPASGWGTAVLMSSSPGIDCEGPSLGVDDAGNAFVFWKQNDAGLWNLYSRRFDSTGWSTPWMLVSDVTSVVVAVAGDGTAHAAYAYYPGSSYTLATLRYSPARGWYGAHALEYQSWAATVSSMAVGRDGTAAAIWMRGHQNWWEESVYAAMFN